jgi:hypothetical protein
MKSVQGVKIKVKRFIFVLFYPILIKTLQTGMTGWFLDQIFNFLQENLRLLYDYVSQYINIGPRWMWISGSLFVIISTHYLSRRCLFMNEAIAFVRQKTRWFDFLPWHNVSPEGYTYQQILDWVKEKSLTVYGYPCVKGKAKWYTFARKIPYEEMPKTPESDHLWSDDGQIILSSEKIPLYLYVKVKRKELNRQVKWARQIKKMATTEEHPD